MLSKRFAKAFGENVRFQRRAQGMSQEALAEKAEWAMKKMISLVERAKRNPTLNVAHSIALGLGLPFWRLIKDSESLLTESQVSEAENVRINFQEN